MRARRAYKRQQVVEAICGTCLSNHRRALDMITSKDKAYEACIDTGVGPGVIERFAAAVATALADLGLGTTPCLSHVTHRPFRAGYLDLAVYVHIVPNLILPVWVVCELDDLDPEEVVFWIRQIWPSRHELAQEAEEVRTAAEQWLNSIKPGLIDLHIVDVRLGSPTSRQIENGLGFELVVESLGDNLRPCLSNVYVPGVDGVSISLIPEVVEHRKRLELRQRCIQHGATGSMNRLTRAAIEHLPDPALALRELGRNQAIWPEEGLHIAWQDGRVVSWADRYQGLTWSGRTLQIAGVELPQTALEASKGKPVTMLCDHPLLDDKMIVARAWNFDFYDDALPTVVIELIDHEYLFSSPHGRIDRRPRKAAHNKRRAP
jgi:hypothetical protein